MNRRFAVALPVCLGIVLVSSCADRESPTEPHNNEAIQHAVMDGAHNGGPDFFWLPPTVPAAPEPTGPFDDTALDELSVEVCLLNGNAVCASPPIARFTSTGTPVPARIQLDAAHEHYVVHWQTGPSSVSPGEFYRVRVLRNHAELGFIDVAIVKNTPELATVDASLYRGLVRGQKLELRFRVQEPAAAAGVMINEVESNGGTPGDWVEFYNTGTSAVDLSGFIIRDNDDTHTAILPAGTVIDAGGYLIVEETTLGYGLGANDAVRLFAPDGTTLIDSYAWPTHAITTYGRCPDGTGEFQTTTTVTKGAANDCDVVVRINEVESSGGTPGDWVELYNAGPVAVNLGGYVFRDNDDTHSYTLPGDVTIAAGGYLVIEEAEFGFGLGAADEARLFSPTGSLVDSYGWTSHAATTYGRCPNGVGEFTTTDSSTKSASNNCGGLATAVRINEIESSGGTPGDWVELYNTGTSVVDLTGYIIKDNDDAHISVLPAGSVIAAGAFLLVEEATLGYGLGGGDAVRLFAPDGSTLLDSYEWTSHASTTYGRCPDGTGEFTSTASVTKGAANDCGGPPAAAPWPGEANVQAVDGSNVFGGNMSGLAYEPSTGTAPGVLWGARNGPGALFRLVWDGATWTPDPTDNWSAGKALRYPDGTGDPDAEGVTFAVTPADGVYVATERNNAASGVSRNSILRFDVMGAGTTLIATNEWNVTSDLPAVGANAGLEAITWIPDAFLVAHSFVDESTGAVYVPADYPNHGTGLFFVGVEATGMIHAYALDHTDDSFARVASLSSGFTGVMALEFDNELNYLWAICDDGCSGRSAILQVDTRVAAPTTGRFIVTHVFERPVGMPNLNNEGFAIAPQAECTASTKPVFWADDGETGGHAIRQGAVTCAPLSPMIANRMAGLRIDTNYR